MSYKEKIAEYLSRNVALYDCQGDCPDEVALNNDLRTDDYCNRCFAKTLVSLLTEDKCPTCGKKVKPY